MSAKKRLYRIAFWGFAAFVLFGTLTPLNGIRIDIEFTWIDIDKLVHLCIFLTLTVLLYIAYPIKLNAFRIFLYLSLYGIIIEVLQHVLPLGRSFDWLDWVYDMIGVGFGLILLHLFKKQIRQQIL